MKCISQCAGREQMAQMARQQEPIDKVNEKTIHDTTGGVKKTDDSGDDPLGLRRVLLGPHPWRKVCSTGLG